jgi:integrase/recombinase XerD
MGHSQTPGVALVASAAEDDWVARLVLAWLAAKRSENTRAAYARDIGVAPVRRTGRAPSWLGWCEASGVHPVTGVTGVDVARYARQLDAAGLAPASVARKLAAVSGWYDWLAQRGHISSSPATGLERPRVHPDTPAPSALTPDQALALVHAADSVQGPQRARTAALVAVLLFTGARVSEVIGADVEDLGTDQERPVLWVTRKHGLRQSLPLPGPAAARIGAYLDSRADLKDVSVPPERSRPGARRALFATATGGRLFAADVWRAVRRAASRAALPDDLAVHLGPHAMRQSFARLYLDEGGSLRDLQAAMGHADPRTTRRYDRARNATGRSPGYVVAAYLAAQGGAGGQPHLARLA